MNAPIIEVCHLSKRYRLGEFSASSLREEMERAWKSIWKRNGHGANGAESAKDFWALKDVSFTVSAGDVVGIIGRNGAGKSTLLKILSRITEPSEGELIMRGRVASLLEVGTGFHPELSGRDNIYLNGAILGMKKNEIDAKFDEIVDFAEVETFIDTPVKRYSSGMYVRLAFAVAAHLEPEILIVDEVLAVGDAQFQKKCLGKMKSVSESGRTVLFVSHNMDTVLRLCNKGVLLNKGTVAFVGSAQDTATEYFRVAARPDPVHDLTTVKRWEQLRLGVKLLSFCVLDDKGEPSHQVPFGQPVTIRTRLHCDVQLEKVQVGLAFHQANGVEVSSFLSAALADGKTLEPGDYELTFRCHGLMPLPQTYYFGIGIKSSRGGEDHVSETGHFEVIQSARSSEAEADTFRGLIYSPWETELVRL